MSVQCGRSGSDYMAGGDCPQAMEGGRALLLGGPYC